MELIRIIIYASIYIGLVTTTFFILSFFSNKKKGELKPLSDSQLPKVTILIPAYNEEIGIIKTINSALGSNYPKDKFEVIVIDDGSKDKTLELAKSIKDNSLQIFSKPNGGKASALNLGISKAKGEIIFTMDADTVIDKDSVKRMVQLFQEEDVVAVSPTMITTKPQTICQRVQYVEYLMGLFLRKVFSGIDSIYISPGAFSAYKKSFFEKYGGYKVGNITEDLEMSLRIQSNHFKIRNCPEAIAYTTPPRGFKELLIQRRRWYVGLIKNTIDYKHMFSRKYGDLGMFIFPLSWITTLMSIIITCTVFFRTIFDVKKELLFLKLIQFKFFDQVSFNLFAVERFVYILEGKIEANIGDNRYSLVKGDTLYFESSLPHYFRNTGIGEARLISVTTPPSV